jgi:hypothetical protein
MLKSIVFVTYITLLFSLLFIFVILIPLNLNDPILISTIIFLNKMNFIDFKLL